MTPGRIAAVITCHNLGRTLLEALASVERQTRPAAEIVVIDGASTEIQTRQMLASLEREGTCVARVDALGASAARNRGVRLTSAEYLVWLDADDVLEPGYFEAAATRLDGDSGIDFVSCAMRAFGAASYGWTPSQPTFVEAIATGAVPHASTMVRRQLWETVGGFDEALQSFELLDFWASVIERGIRGVILDEPLLNYRVRPGSGYRRSIQGDTYMARLEHFYAKHRAAVERHGLDLIQAKEAFFVSQREYRQQLEARTASLDGELARLQLQIAETARTLEARDEPRVDWGDLRRLQPISPCWGRDRGTPVDRYYINGFLDAHQGDVRGRVLEVRDAVYTRRFGGDAVTASDVVDLNPGNGAATVIADLRHADAIPTDTYDCIILTQTLQLIDDIGAAIAECARILRPGGVLLATAPCIIRVDDEGGPDGDFWRLTEASARKLFAEAFPVDAFEVTAYGNVMACAAFLYGLSIEEVSAAELDHVDQNFPQIIAIRAVKPHAAAVVSGSVVSGFPVPTKPRSGGGGSRTPARSFPAAILAYHRVASLTPDLHALCTPPDVFRAHMTHLRDNFFPMPLDDLVRAAASGRIPERAVAVTLDDGYLDALTVASPILAALGVPATFFVNTDRLHEEHERWWDMLERIFLTEATLPSILTLQAGGQTLQMPTATAQQRADALDLLNRTAWPLDANSRERIVDDVLAWSGAAPSARASHRVVTDRELLSLAGRPGHTIGAHTTHHLALTTSPLETKRQEVLENKAALERALNQPVYLFSYPYGDFDAETIAIVGAAGYRAAVTVEAGLVTAGTNRLLLPRNEITPGDHDRFTQRMDDIFGSG